MSRKAVFSCGGEVGGCFSGEEIICSTLLSTSEKVDHLPDAMRFDECDMVHFLRVFSEFSQSLLPVVGKSRPLPTMDLRDFDR